jgi:Zn-dependent protease
MLVVPLLTALSQGWAIGWASTPYDPRWAAMYPRRAAIMAAAGPVGNLIIAAAAFALLRIGLEAGWFVPAPHATFERLVMTPGGLESLLGTMLSILLVLNVLLAAFNMIPLPPLDGASVLGLLLPPQLSWRMREVTATPMFQIVGLLVAWRIFPMLARPLFSLVLRLVHPGLSYG